jgi:hypothetical protein
VNDVADISDRTPTGSSVTARSPDGKLRSLIKVAELPPHMRGLLGTPHRSVWLDAEVAAKIERRHPIIRDIHGAAREILEHPSPDHTTIQLNAQAHAYRFYRQLESLGLLVGKSRRERYAYMVIHCAGGDSPHPYNFIKTFHTRRAILADRSMLWP